MAMSDQKRMQSDGAVIMVHDRRLVFENTVFSVYLDHIADKNGNKIPKYLSVAPKCLVADSRSGVAVLPLGNAYRMIKNSVHGNV